MPRIQEAVLPWLALRGEGGLLVEGCESLLVNGINCSGINCISALLLMGGMGPLSSEYFDTVT